MPGEAFDVLAWNGDALVVVQPHEDFVRDREIGKPALLVRQPSKGLEDVAASS